MASLRRVIAALALTAGLVPITAGTAHAVSPALITCTAAGTVFFTNGSVDRFSISGKGSCQGDLEGTYFLDFTGEGTSDTTGYCDPAATVFTVNNLDIHVVGTLTNTGTLIPKALNQHWVAPVTTYPLVTPFLIQTGGSPNGAGVFENHIFLNCMGSPVADFQFAFLV